MKRPEVIADPSSYIRAIAEVGPLFFDEVGRVWVCSGYAEADEILRDHRRFSSVREHGAGALRASGLRTSSSVGEMVREQILFQDPPRHTEIRSSFGDQFSRTRLNEREPALKEIAERLVGDLPAEGEIDLIADFAARLPPALMAFLLGMPGQEERINRWAEAYERLLGSLSALPHIGDTEAEAVLSEALAGFEKEARLRLDAPGDDVISTMVSGLAESDDRALFSIAANCVVMVGGGYQTLTHLVSTGLLLLHRHPEQLQQVREKPNLLEQAVEEFMRLDGSSQYVARRAVEDVEIGGVTIAAGQSVLVHLAAANRDPRVFPEPERLDLRRGAKHLGFGAGRHYCTGSAYAEQLARWAVNAFLERYPEYEPDPGSLVWGHHPNTRCLASARIRVRARTDTPPCWHEVFEHGTRLTPNAVAVDGPDGSLTYRELDERANALAHRLRGHGVQPGTVVMVALERSAEFVAAVLAVGKAGGAFLLTEPTSPRERLRAMAAEASVTLLITRDTDLATDLGLPGCMPDDMTEPAPARAPLTGVCGGDTAYVVFTSGTTGVPKAIAISHEALVNLHTAQREIFRLRPGDRVLQFLSPNFDGCVADLALGLLTGATLVVAPTARLTVGPTLIRLLRAERITAVILTPSVWEVLPDDPLPDLRVAAAAGERLPAAWVRRWSVLGRRLLNLYGPAETAVMATWHECTEPSGEPPIGRPVANKRIYVLDEQRCPVADGQPGELTIGGVGIGRYLNRPELMEERFAPEPGGGLMYLTGDICRARPDGVLEYLGRRDRQVKIRGQRVELDEVERVLESAPGVAACLAHARDGRIEVLVVPAGDRVDEVRVRSHLAERLHGGMVPAVITAVAELPRTANGKSAVPDRPTSSKDAERRRSRLTWEVSRLFARALNLSLRQVQADSDFFTSGGDSLAMASFLHRLERLTGGAVDVEALIAAPTPEGIAAVIVSGEGIG
ncbi:amino acid adenylation domain-containing protein [Streptosporangium sp. NPDC002721]|uniref:amino acid adenylation domain-containing protein n=1 Tax=Streptosporangium sp. NPDC002721 TaxID=3366188 RepID=UPI0036800766